MTVVREAWAQHGLESATAFFPSGYDTGTIALCECVFRDDAAVAASFASPQAGPVRDDIKHFTDAQPA